MIDHDVIYREEAARYDRLVAREDQAGNLLKAVRAVMPDLEAKDAADIGAGTGRLTSLLAPHVRSIRATDASEAMLRLAAERLRASGAANWTVAPGANDRLPLADRSADLLTAGWTICYSASSSASGWRDNLRAIMAEIDRVLRPGGAAIVFENFGTGSAEPNPPEFLTAYYAELQNRYGYKHVWIRTDYRFETNEEAVALTDFFFGGELSQALAETGATELPECTGVWWKHV
ncbi:Methyltransferase domain-containing protein [Paenibacillus sp. UNC496MF]|uniref:class I SAM-dependent methyltransferase n=1 Tax=Paenibacillus sp. UNC496MF TaxID=1502753 RepID=UPI0008EF3876|nr:class I SAM-dependent methyltransferase [Paenibacillus sp. UNC496MF]SFI29753.1 Methyltransferase domain-containing protein [Paenibacillus sp. UNC496MF]